MPKPYDVRDIPPDILQEAVLAGLETPEIQIALQRVASSIEPRRDQVLGGCFYRLGYSVEVILGYSVEKVYHEPRTPLMFEVQARMWNQEKSTWEVI